MEKRPADNHIDDCREGDYLLVDNGFTCMEENEIKEIKMDNEGMLYIECKEGNHYLEGQLDDTGNLIGLSIYHYKKPYKVMKYTDLYTIEEWKEACDVGAFIDYDGYGTLLMERDGDYYPVRDNFCPSDYTSNRRKIPNYVTHISWYNK